MKKIFSSIIAMTIGVAAFAVSPSDVKIYINPGHGGYDSDDRVNTTLHPFQSGDTMTYAESKSNLFKGFRLRQLLWEQGIEVAMSRVANTSADDLGLETIGLLANASGADIFLSIHSNATGITARRNFPLELFRGYDGEAQIPGSLEWGTYMCENLLKNQTTIWTSTSSNVRGDWSFQAAWGTQGYGVLRRNTIPSILSEDSFHDYIPEAYRYLNDDYCWTMAWNARKAVQQYFGLDGVDYGAIAGRINDDRIQRNVDYICFDDDKLDALHSVKVELYDESGAKIDEDVTDNLYNGIYAFRKLTPGKYKLKFSNATHYPYEQDVEVKADECSYVNVKMKKIRNTAPEVVSYSPVYKDGDEPVLCNSQIILNFNWDMDTESTEAAFSIEPAVEGTITWEDQNYRMIFTPTNTYDVNTVYTVKLAATASHPDGMSMTAPVEFKFLTAATNYMSITSQFPNEGDKVHYTKPTFELRFDRHPSGTGATSFISVVDSKGAKVALNSRTIKVSNNVSDEYGWMRVTCSKDLTPGETYTLTISPNIQDYDGIKLKEGSVVTFTAVNAGEEKTTETLDAMEDATKFSQNTNGCVNVQSQSVTATSTKLFGTKSLNFAYEFTSTSGGELLWSRSNTAIVPAEVSEITSVDALGFHVYGDLSGNGVYIELTSDLEVKYIHVCDLNFLGWKYVEVPLSELVANASNQFTGIKLAQIESLSSRKGSFQIDEIKYIPNGALGVENVFAPEVSVYPNPASEYLIASADGFVTRIELVSMGGTTVATAMSNVLNVSEVAEGTYIANIYTAQGCAVKKVVIKH